jgi:ribosomal protein S18 acetylase RimI-like enzyme
MNSFLVRAASSSDAEGVTHVLIESRREFLTYAPSPYSCDETLAWVGKYLLPTERVTVATIQGEIVAVLAVSEDDDQAWVDQLYVLPSYQNKNIGNSLLTLAHETLKRPIRLFTFQQNIGARRFYERHGYKAEAFSDGQSNDEKCPDVLYKLNSPALETREEK